MEVLDALMHLTGGAKNVYSLQPARATSPPDRSGQQLRHCRTMAPPDLAHGDCFSRVIAGRQRRTIVACRQAGMWGGAPIAMLAALAADARRDIAMCRRQSREAVACMPGLLGNGASVPAGNEERLRRAFSAHHQALLRRVRCRVFRDVQGNLEPQVALSLRPDRRTGDPTL